MSADRPERARSRHPWWWVGGGVAVAALMAFGVGPRVQRWRAHEEASERHGLLLACLLGPHAELSAAELRAREIGASLSGAPEGGWPQRCAEPALQLDAAVQRLLVSERGRCAPGPCCAGDGPCEALAQLGGVTGPLRRELAGGRIALARVSLVRELGWRGGLRAPAPPPAAELPAPAKLWSLAGLEPLDHGPADLTTDSASGPDALVTFVEPGRKARACRVRDAATPSAHARCAELQRPLGGQAPPWPLASEPGGPSRLIVSSPTRLVDLDTGRSWELPTGDARGGYVWRSGATVVLMAAADGSTMLVSTGTDAPAVDTSVELPESVTVGPEVVLDQLLWALPSDSGGHRIFASPLSPDDSLLGPQQELSSTGALAGPPLLQSCRSGETTAVLVHAEPQGYLTEGVLLFHTAGRWQPPVRVRAESDLTGLTCYGDSASLSWIDTLDEQPLGEASLPDRPVAGRYSVHRLQCSASGCHQDDGELGLQRWSRTSRYLIADLGASMLIVWRSPLGDVRARAGAPAELAQRPDVPLFDDEAHGGFAWELGRGTTFARSGTGLLFARSSPETQHATYGFILTAQAELRPIALDR